MPVVINGTTGVNTDGQGNLTFSGTGQRIVGDFSNATLANRVYFQSPTSTQTALGVLPGSGFAIAAANIFSQSDPANSALLQMRIENGVDARISSAITGTGSFLPMTFYTGGSERMRLDTSGNLGIGTSSPINLLTVQTAATGTTAGSNVIARLQSNAAGRDATLQLSDNVANSATISMVGGAVAVAQNGVERTRIDTSGNFQFNSGYGSVATAFGCRAWVNFNGTGTVAIRASGNVSSITDNGVGDYTVNFTTAMPDANSSVNVTCQRMDVTSFEATYSGIRSNTSSNITTTSVRVYTAFSTTAGFDAGQVCVAVFR